VKEGDDMEGAGDWWIVKGRRERIGKQRRLLGQLDSAVPDGAVYPVLIGQVHLVTHAVAQAEARLERETCQAQWKSRPYLEGSLFYRVYFYIVECLTIVVK